ncbi:serine hydrolase [Crocinitomix catalasitica]|uniref:serine hydrolase n=1 Tax=Crocinitomix catalasitica TaxID=184607 RepID=UPI0004873900|nr:serine hydrolase [Crocinitomix catalasitica]
MKRITFLICVLFLNLTNVNAQGAIYFPPLAGDSWETISLSELGWCEDEIPPLYEYLDDQNTKAFLVLKDGKIVLEKYFDTFTKDSLWYWASAGKGLTAFLTGIAQQEALLSITDTTSTYLGEGWTSCTPEQEEKITILNQITMTTGLDEEFEAYCTDPECLIFKADVNERWAYHNSPYTLMDEVISSATGLSMNLYLNSRVKSRTGMDGVYVPVDDNNVFFSTPRSMARFGLLMLNRGQWDLTDVLTDEVYFDAMVSTSQSLNEAYGYLWWLNGKESYMLPQTEMVFDGPLIEAAPDDMFAAIGKNGQYLNVVPSENLIVIRMGQAPTGLESLVPTVFNNTIWEYLNEIMCGVAGVEDLVSTDIKLYPNPVSDLLSFENNDFHFYEIYDVHGRVVLTGELTVGINEINVSELQNEMYLFNLRDKEGNTKMLKFVK